MASAGGAMLLAYWLPRTVLRRGPSSYALLIVLGLLAYHVVPGMPAVLNPTTAPRTWESVSEVVVIVVLFATGLRLDNIRGWQLWSPTVRLLAIAMPLTIAAVAALGWGLAGMTLAGALLLGAVLAPTDPVLAGDVQVGPPLEGGEHPVRFTLTAEAGLNDGLTFPFVHLGLVIAVEGAAFGDWAAEWVLRDVLYRILVGAAVGAAVGWLLGKIIFATTAGSALAETGPGVIALAGVLLCYGAVELVEGYGFIGAFVAGVVCRQAEAGHEFHRRLHNFSDAIENAFTAVLLLLLGSAMPMLWPVLDWRHTLIGFGLLLVIRPLAAWISLAGTTALSSRDRWIVAFFGVRGIGSIYYLGYATGHMEFVNENELWALVAFTIFASTVIHGIAGRWLIDR